MSITRYGPSIHFPAGTSATFRVSARQFPTGGALSLTGATITGYLKRTEATADADAEVELTVASGGIVIADAVAGIFDIVFAPEDTAPEDYTAGRPWFRYVRFEDADGKIFIIAGTAGEVHLDATTPAVGTGSAVVAYAPWASISAEAEEYPASTYATIEYVDDEVAAVASDLTAHIADAVGAHAATAISATPSGSLAGTTVAAQLVELDTEKAPTNSEELDTQPLDLARRMYASVATTIGFYGDSTFESYLEGGGTASPTVIEVAQTALRAYFVSAYATCVNYGVSGTDTSDYVSGWAATMAADTSHFIGLGWCINDSSHDLGNLTVAEYMANYRTLIRLARAAGKGVFVVTPNPFSNRLSGWPYRKAATLRPFVDAQRQVAWEMGCTIVDRFEAFERWMSVAENTDTFLGDGPHPTQLGYRQQGYFIAAQLAMGPGSLFRNIGAGYQLLTNGGWAISDGVNVNVEASGTRTGYTRTGRTQCGFICVDAPGLDLYVSTAMWASGGASCTLKIDGVQVGPTLNATGVLTANYAVEHDVMVAENLRPGIHFIEYSSTANDVSTQYLRLARTRRVVADTGYVSPADASPTASLPRVEIAGASIVNGATVDGYSALLTDIPHACNVVGSRVVLRAQLEKGAGIILFCRRTSTNTAPMGGVAVYLNKTTGYLHAARGAETDWKNAAGSTGSDALGSVDLSGVLRTYVLDTAAQTGVVRAFVDGTLIGTFTQPTSPRYLGGNIGWYFEKAAAAIEVEYLSIASGTGPDPRAVVRT